MYSRYLTPLVWILTFFVLLFIYTKFIGPIPFSINSVTTTKSDTFQVSGEGKVSVPPDVALINVGVQAQASTVKEAQEFLNSNINKVSEAIKKVGVDQKDIQTTNYNVYPNTDFMTGTQRVTGYTASTNLNIKVREIDKANAVIDEATKNGANQIGGVTFDIDDKTKLENEAREKAVADAKSKAENAAKIAGFRLGRMINYQENFGGYPVPMPLRAMGAPEAVSDRATQIEPGTNEIRVIVTLSFEIQ